MLASTEILSQAEQAASTCGGNAPLVEDRARHMRWSGREEVAREADLPCAAAAVQYSDIRTYTHTRAEHQSVSMARGIAAANVSCCYLSKNGVVH